MAEPGHEVRPRVLLLCDYRPHEAATVVDHIEAIRRWSAYDVHVMPMRGDIPPALDLDAFDAVVIHYSLVMAFDNYLSPLARWRIRQFPGVKAAFIQDEYRFVDATVDVMRFLGVSLVLTCVPADQVHKVYPGMRTVTVLTGYVPEELLARPIPDYDARTVDVGYRGRRLPPWLGRLAQEKVWIAERFAADAPTYGLKTDISCSEDDRLYGDAWVGFIQSCRAMLGVESGASVFDFDESIERDVRAYLGGNPNATFEDIHARFLMQVDGRVTLNQISPRCFEAAALGTLMILYDGEYSGILEPWRHYVPLRKDHSNMAEVIAAVRDEAIWKEITDRARTEIALNPAYSFRAMVAQVDQALALSPTADRLPQDFAGVAQAAYRGLTPANWQTGYPGKLVWSARRILQLVAKLLRPDPAAMSRNAERGDEKLHGLRARIRATASWTWWVVHPRQMPSGLLRPRTAGPLLAELADLQTLQRMGAEAAVQAGSSPYRLALRHDSPAVAIEIGDTSPGDRTRASLIAADLAGRQLLELDLTTRWAAPSTVSGRPRQGFPALSALMQRRPDVVAGLLSGERPWAHVVTPVTASAESIGGGVSPKYA